MKAVRPRIRATAPGRKAAGRRSSFTADARAELSWLHEDDVVTAQGEARLGTYTGKSGDVRPCLEITALHVLALRQPKPAKAPANESERTYN
jgi:hypothetical protein